MNLKSLVSAILPTRVVARVRGGRSPPTLFLTFDDGPHPRHTPPLLDTLDAWDAKATFFLIGRTAIEQRALASLIAARGHAIASHSMNHPWMDRMAARDCQREIDDAHAVLRSISPNAVPLFRPPHGAVSLRLLTFCLLRGHRMALWSRDSFDYRCSAAEIIDGFTTAPPRAGDVILFHDDAPVANEALRTLLPMWKAAGFSFRELSIRDL